MTLTSPALLTRVLETAIAEARRPVHEGLPLEAVQHYLDANPDPLLHEIASITSHIVDSSVTYATHDLLTSYDEAETFLRFNAHAVAFEVMMAVSDEIEEQLLANTYVTVMYYGSRASWLIDDNTEANEVLDTLHLLDLTITNLDNELEQMVGDIVGQHVMIGGETVIKGTDLIRAKSGEPITLDRVHIVVEDNSIDFTVSSTSYPMHTFIPMTGLFVIGDGFPDEYSTESGLVPASVVSEVA